MTALFDSTNTEIVTDLKLKKDTINNVKSKIGAVSDAANKEKNKKEYLKIVKKVARRLCCGDQEYKCWILEKLSKYSKDEVKNDIKIEFYYPDPKTPEKKKYFGCAVIKTISGTSPKAYETIKAPKKNKNDKCAVPNIWCEDDTNKLVVEITEDEAGKTIKTNFVRAEKITFIMKNEVNSAIAMLELLKNTTKKQIKCYQNEFNMNLCKKLALVPVERKYILENKYIEETGKLNKIPVRLSCINLNFHGPFEYISAGKTNKEVVKNLVLFPNIDKFYALNSHLVNSSIKNEMKSLACCYDLVKKRTGYCYFNEGYNTGFNITVKQKEIFDAGSFRAIAAADVKALT